MSWQRTAYPMESSVAARPLPRCRLQAGARFLRCGWAQLCTFRPLSSCLCCRFHLPRFARQSGWGLIWNCLGVDLVVCCLWRRRIGIDFCSRRLRRCLERWSYFASYNRQIDVVQSFEIPAWNWSHWLNSVFQWWALNQWCFYFGRSCW